MNKRLLALVPIAALATLGALSLPPGSGRRDLTTGVGSPGRRPARTAHLRPPTLTTTVQEQAPPTPATRLREALDSGDPQVRVNALQRRLRRWAHRDAAGAARFALEIVDAPLRDHAVRVVAQIWGQEDAEAAAAWGAASLPDELERRGCLGAVCLGLAVVDPGKSVQMADSLGLGNDGGTLENLTAQWAARDEGAALAWVCQRPAGPERDRLLQRLALAVAQNDPARAARLVVDLILPGDVQTEAVVSVVNQWAQRDPAGAAAWVAVFPPGVVRDRARGELPGATYFP